jgi:hypothetical protein
MNIAVPTVALLLQLLPSPFSLHQIREFLFQSIGLHDCTLFKVCRGKLCPNEWETDDGARILIRYT